MNISPSAFAPENLVSQDGFGSPVPRKLAHLHTQAESGAYLRDCSRVPRRRPFIYLTPSGQSRVYRVTQLRTNGVHCRESAGTGPVVPNKVVPVTGAALAGHHGSINLRLSFLTQTQFKSAPPSLVRTYGSVLALRSWTIVSCVCLCLCAFIKLHLTAQSGPLILVIICHIFDDPQQRSTGSSSFSDELAAQRGPEARRASGGSRRNTFSSAGESSTSNGRIMSSNVMYVSYNGREMKRGREAESTSFGV